MRDEDWFILQLDHGDTLPLCRTLNEDGIEAWVPTFMSRLPFPRHKLKPEGVETALMPGFVFVRVPHLLAVLDLARSGRPHRHRSFRVFSPHGGVHTITDSTLDGLRLSELEAVPRKARPVFQRGRRVRASERCPFVGFVGKVERCKDGWALVLFDGWRRAVKLSTSFLTDDSETQVRKAA